MRLLILLYHSAIEATFHGVSLVHCSIHLRKNLKRFLSKKLDFPSKKVNKIVDRIFGGDGLLSHSSVVGFDYALEEFIADYPDLMEKTYMVNFMERIRKNVHSPHIQTNGRLKIRHTYGKFLKMNSKN